MKNQLTTLLAVFVLLIATACEEQDPRAASPIYTNLSELYDFFNEIRYEVAVLEGGSPHLTNFTSDTKKFLENKTAQGTYDVAGLYFEKGLNREKGAYDYSDRFFADGCVIHVVILPASAEERWKSLVGVNKNKGKQVGQNFILYQVFTAQPTDTQLEGKIFNIIESKISKHAAQLGQTF